MFWSILVRPASIDTILKPNKMSHFSSAKPEYQYLLDINCTFRWLGLSLQASLNHSKREYKWKPGRSEFVISYHETSAWGRIGIIVFFCDNWRLRIYPSFCAVLLPSSSMILNWTAKYPGFTIFPLFLSSKGRDISASRKNSTLQWITSLKG